MRLAIWVLMFALMLICSWAQGQSMTSVCTDGQCVTVNANGTGAHEYAVRMNRGGFFRHDAAFRGPEVIFKSSGQATPQEAHQAWMNSPPHRRLVSAGLIQDVKCVGSVCVGRGSGDTASAPFLQAAGKPIRHLAPLKRIRNLSFRCR